MLVGFQIFGWVYALLVLAWIIFFMTSNKKVKLSLFKRFPVNLLFISFIIVFVIMVLALSFQLTYALAGYFNTSFLGDLFRIIFQIFMIIFLVLGIWSLFKINDPDKRGDALYVFGVMLSFSYEFVALLVFHVFYM